MSNCYDIPLVIICVRGGVAEVFRKDKDVCVEIRDYDIDGCEEKRLEKDKDGDEYISSIYEAGE